MKVEDKLSDASPKRSFKDAWKAETEKKTGRCFEASGKETETFNLTIKQNISYCYQ